MGLDMYAARRLDVTQRDYESPEERHTVTVKRGGTPVSGIQPNRISAVEEEVMHWWKAYHIHKWFVDNVQDGRDDCKPYYVDWDVLQELLSVCRKVLKASRLVEGQVFTGWYRKPGMTEEDVKLEPGLVIEDSSTAQKLLPTKSGFFLGPEEYAQHYYNQVAETQDWAARMLTDYEAGVPGDIFYSSSW